MLHLSGARERPYKSGDRIGSGSVWFGHWTFNLASFQNQYRIMRNFVKAKVLRRKEETSLSTAQVDEIRGRLEYENRNLAYLEPTISGPESYTNSHLLFYIQRASEGGNSLPEELEIIKSFGEPSLQLKQRTHKLINLEENKKKKIDMITDLMLAGDCFNSLDFFLSVKSDSGSNALVNSSILDVLRCDKVYVSFLIATVLFKRFYSVRFDEYDSTLAHLCTILGMYALAGLDTKLDLWLSPRVICKIPGQLSGHKSGTVKYTSEEFVVTWVHDEKSTSYQILSSLCVSKRAFHILPFLFDVKFERSLGSTQSSIFPDLFLGKYSIVAADIKSFIDDLNRKLIHNVKWNIEKKGVKTEYSRSRVFAASLWFTQLGFVPMDHQFILFKLGVKLIMHMFFNPDKLSYKPPHATVMFERWKDNSEGRNVKVKMLNCFWHTWHTDYIFFRWSRKEMQLFIENGGAESLRMMLTKPLIVWLKRDDALQFSSLFYPQINVYVFEYRLSAQFYSTIWLVLAEATMMVDESAITLGLSLIAAANDADYFEKSLSQIEERMLAFLIVPPVLKDYEGRIFDLGNRPCALLVALRNGNKEIVSIICRKMRYYRRDDNKGKTLVQIVDKIFNCLFTMASDPNRNELNELYEYVEQKALEALS